MIVDRWPVAVGYFVMSIILIAIGWGLAVVWEKAWVCPQ